VTGPRHVPGSATACSCECRCGPNQAELRVIALVAAGTPLADIAARLCFSEHTVSTYIRNARTRLGARDRAHLVTLAFRGRLLEFDRVGNVVLADASNEAAA
jgi:DNA-binding CsgD family transcriptional regulator